MSNFSTRNKNQGTGIAQVILSLIAFTCMILSIAMQFPDRWYVLDTLVIIVQIAPCAFVFYTVICHGKIGKEILLSILFSLFATYPILLIISDGYNRHLNTGNIIYIIEAICHLLATISIARKSKKRFFPVLAICLSAVTELVFLFNLFSFYSALPETIAKVAFIFPQFLNIVGYLAVYSVSISILFTTNPAPITNTYQSTAQQELSALQDKFTNGNISEEAYKKQRTEIINNL